jgi:hypothetical protein
MHSTKEDIEQFTRSAFFDLIWKKETYETVNINDSYQLQLIHKKTKKNWLGTASAAERELLTLSFTLGIHSISGFDAPLLIDKALANIGGIVSNPFNCSWRGNFIIEIGDKIGFIHKGHKLWEGNKNEILKSDCKELNDFVFASNMAKQLKRFI